MGRTTKDGSVLIRPFQSQTSYTVFHNILLDVIMPELSANSWKCLTLIVRRTIGWGKDSETLSYEQFRLGTGIQSDSTIRAALMPLQQQNYIIVTIAKRPNNGEEWQPNSYKLNTALQVRVVFDQSTGMFQRVKNLEIDAEKNECDSGNFSGNFSGDSPTTVSVVRPATETVVRRTTETVVDRTTETVENRRNKKKQSSVVAVEINKENKATAPKKNEIAPLHPKAAADHREISDFLLQHGCDPGQTNKYASEFINLLGVDALAATRLNWPENGFNGANKPFGVFITNMRAFIANRSEKTVSHAEWAEMTKE